MRLLHRDIHEHKLHLEICMDSEYEILLNEEEIIPLAEPKPELLPESATPTLFDLDYIPQVLSSLSQPLKWNPLTT